MAYIQYPAHSARTNNDRNFLEAKEVYFNALMLEIQVHSRLQATKLDVHEVSAFNSYGMQPLFEAQGYVVEQVGAPNQTIKYVISWE